MSAQKEVIYDDNGRIQYSSGPGWRQQGGVTGAQGGGNTHAPDSQGSSLTLQFEGTGVDVFGYVNNADSHVQWDLLSCTIAGESGSFSNSKPYNSPSTAATFCSISGLPNRQHTLQVKVGNDFWNVLLDGFRIYADVDDEPPPPPPPPPPTKSSTTTTRTTTTTKPPTSPTDTETTTTSKRSTTTDSPSKQTSTDEPGSDTSTSSPSPSESASDSDSSQSRSSQSTTASPATRTTASLPSDPIFISLTASGEPAHGTSAAAGIEPPGETSSPNPVGSPSDPGSNDRSSNTGAIIGGVVGGLLLLLLILLVLLLWRRRLRRRDDPSRRFSRDDDMSTINGGAAPGLTTWTPEMFSVSSGSNVAVHYDAPSYGRFADDPSASPPTSARALIPQRYEPQPSPTGVSDDRSNSHWSMSTADLATRTPLSRESSWYAV